MARALAGLINFDIFISFPACSQTRFVLELLFFYFFFSKMHSFFRQIFFFNLFKVKLQI